MKGLTVRMSFTDLHCSWQTKQRGGGIRTLMKASKAHVSMSLQHPFKACTPKGHSPERTRWQRNRWAWSTSPRIHQEHTKVFRHKSACRTPSESGQEYLTRGKEYISSVQSLSHVWLFATPRITACHASLSITNSQSLLRLMSIESVMPSSHLKNI